MLGTQTKTPENYKTKTENKGTKLRDNKIKSPNLIIRIKITTIIIKEIINPIVIIPK